MADATVTCAPGMGGPDAATATPSASGVWSFAPGAIGAESGGASQAEGQEVLTTPGVCGAYAPSVAFSLGATITPGGYGVEPETRGAGFSAGATVACEPGDAARSLPTTWTVAAGFTSFPIFADNPTDAPNATVTSTVADIPKAANCQPESAGATIRTGVDVLCQPGDGSVYAPPTASATNASVSASPGGPSPYGWDASVRTTASVAFAAGDAGGRASQASASGSIGVVNVTIVCEAGSTNLAFSGPVAPRMEWTVSVIGGTSLAYDQPFLPTAVTHAVFYGGKFYGVSYYDEGGQVTSVIDWPNNAIGSGGTYILGLEQHGGRAICANSTYVYSTQWVKGVAAYADEWPALYPGYVDYGSNVYDVNAWEGIQRRTRSTMAPSLFTGGKLWTGQPVTGDASQTGCFKKLYEYQWWDHNVVILERTTAELTGIACTETEVFVSHPYTSSIYVLDAETMALLRTLTVGNPGPLAIAADGNLWCRLTTGTIRKFNKTTGSLMGIVPSSTLADKIGVLADGRLWHSNSDDFKIRIRSADGATIQETFGNSILTAGGEISMSRANLGPLIGFHFESPHYYVMHQFLADAYGVVACKYDLSGGTLTRFYSTHFLETGDFDLEEGKYYSHFHRFTFDQDAEPQSDIEAYTYDQNNAAADYRAPWFTVSTYLREIEGRKFLYEFAQMGRQLTFREIIDGVNRNRPAGMYSTSGFWRPTDDGTLAPNLPTEYIADPRGANGGIWLNAYVDTEGTIWTTVISYPHDYIGFGNGFSVQRHECLGLDANNNPIYNWTTGFEELATDGLLGDGGEDDVVVRFYYIPETDTAILTGYTASHPGELYDPDATYRYRYEGAGDVLRCYGNWRGVNGTRYIKWTITPDTTAAILIKAVHFAGEVVALGYMATPRIELRRLSDGVLIGELASTGQTGTNTYWIDAHHGVRVVSLDSSNKNYRVVQERGIGGSALLYSVTIP